MSRVLTGKWQWNGRINPMYAADMHIEHRVFLDDGFVSNGQKFKAIRFYHDGSWILKYETESGTVNAGGGYYEDDFAEPFKPYDIMDFGNGCKVDDDSDGTFVNWLLSNTTRYGTAAEKIEQIAKNERKIHRAYNQDKVEDGEKQAYYGDADIKISDERLFIFTELDDGTYSIAAKDVWSLAGHIVLPYKHNGKLVTEITGSGGFGTVLDGGHITSITGITIPRTIRKINNTAFARNDIPEIIIPGSCKEIGATAFYQCQMKKLVLEEGVEVIGANAFTACNKVTHCVIPATLKEVKRNSFAGAGQKKDVYFGGSQAQFKDPEPGFAGWEEEDGSIRLNASLEEVLKDWIWQANVYYNYGNDVEVSKATTNNAKNIGANAIAIEVIKTAMANGMTINETILYSGDKFYIHPNSFYFAMPPSKKLAIYYGDGRADDPYEDEAGILVGVNSAVNPNDGKFRSATIIQTAGSILSSSGTAIYAYFYDNADEIEGGTGAYLQWNGASDTYCPILHSAPVKIEE